MENFDSDTDSDVDIPINFDSSIRPNTPTDLVEVALAANQELLPMKSKDRYTEVYDKYQKWKESKNATFNSETVVLAYMSEMANSKNKKNKNHIPTKLFAMRFRKPSPLLSRIFCRRWKRDWHFTHAKTSSSILNKNNFNLKINE